MRQIKTSEQIIKEWHEFTEANKNGELFDIYNNLSNKFYRLAKTLKEDERNRLTCAIFTDIQNNGFISPMSRMTFIHEAEIITLMDYIKTIMNDILNYQKGNDLDNYINYYKYNEEPKNINICVTNYIENTFFSYKFDLFDESFTIEQILPFTFFQLIQQNDEDAEKFSLMLNNIINNKKNITDEVNKFFNNFRGLKALIKTINNSNPSFTVFAYNFGGF